MGLDVRLERDALRRRAVGHPPRIRLDDVEVHDEARRVETGRQAGACGAGARSTIVIAISACSTIGVRSSPSRSIRSVTTSPGSRYRPSVSSRISSRQPPPTVPIQPGRPAAALRRPTHASIWPKLNCASDHRPLDVSTPLTSAVIARSGPVTPSPRTEASSSGVTSHGPIELAKSLPLAGPRRTVVLIALQVADQSLKIVAADRLLRSVGRQVAGRRVDESSDLQLVVQLRRAGRRPDRLVRPSDLGDVAEVEDRQRYQASAPRRAAPPHRRDVPLERVEVPERRRAKDRRTEDQVIRREDCVVLVGPPCSANPSTSSPRFSTQAARHELVERRDRPDGATSRGPAGSAAIARRRAISRSIQRSSASGPSMPAARRHGAPAGRAVRGRQLHRASVGRGRCEPSKVMPQTSCIWGMHPPHRSGDAACRDAGPRPSRPPPERLAGR